MSQNCYVVTLKYSPIMWNHGRALGEALRARGATPRYLLDGGYAWMLDRSHPDASRVPLGSSGNPLVSAIAWTRGGSAAARAAFRRHRPDLLLFVNLNPFVDRFLLRLARKANPDVRVVTLLHEPYTVNKRVYGWKRALLLRVFEWLSRDMANRSDAVILPSAEAHEAFTRFYRRFRGEARTIPLAFLDQRCPEGLERRYVSFVGHIANAYQKGLDLFLDMVEASIDRPGDYAFQLVTSGETASVVARLSPEARERLRVIHSPQLSDQAISRAIRESVAVALLQRRVLQSGVLPMAMMNGTPVIASDLPGLTQFVEHGTTGWVVPVDATREQRFAAVEAIRASLPAMSTRCRTLYESTFDSRCVAAHVPWILGAEPPARTTAARSTRATGGER